MNPCMYIFLIKTLEGILREVPDGILKGITEPEAVFRRIPKESLEELIEKSFKEFLEQP